MPLLLDTCAVVWLAAGAPLAAPAAEALARADAEGETLHVAPMTAWEIGMLVARGRIALTSPPGAWFARFIAQPGVALAPQPVEVLIGSSFLPGMPPRDPADRIIIATARAEGFAILTRDALILDYAASGHVQAIAC